VPPFVGTAAHTHGSANRRESRECDRHFRQHPECFRRPSLPHTRHSNQWELSRPFILSVILRDTSGGTRVPQKAFPARRDDAVSHRERLFWDKPETKKKPIQRGA